jgi:hypothetical protein
MAAGSQTDPAAPDAPHVGQLRDIKTRHVQRMGGSDNCLGSNLSELGATVLGVEHGDEVQLHIYDDAVVVKRG